MDTKISLIRIDLDSKKRLAALSISALSITAATILYIHNPATSNSYPACPFYHFTGLYCPGCGSLRGTHQLLHGHFLNALGYNPLMVLSIPFVAYLLLAELDIEIKGKKVFKKINFSPLFYKILIGVILLYWILRNIPFYPFTILAP